MAKTLKQLLEGIPEDQREDFLNDPANGDAIAEAEKETDASSEEDRREPAVIAKETDEGKTGGGDGVSDAAGIVKPGKSGDPAEAETEAGGYGSYIRYTESPAVAAARAALDRLTEPSPYSSVWQSRLSAAAERILGRQAFSYDHTADPLYALYADEYKKQGRAAYEDAMGRAAAYTGGYSSSYAASAANAAYLEHVSKLSDRLPELYAAALKRYDSDTAAMYDEFDMLRSLENDEYSRYRSAVSDYRSERDRLEKAVSDERDADLKRYSAEADARYKADTLAQKREQSDAELAFKKEQSDADRAFAADKLEKELAYKAEADRLRYGAGNAASEAEKPAESDKSGETYQKGRKTVTLDGIKKDFYGLLTGQGMTTAFAYIDSLVSDGSVSIQAARSVLSECGVLEEYLNRKRRTGGSSGGGTAALNAVM